MPKPLFVYGVNYDGRRRVIAGVRSRAEFNRLAGLPDSRSRTYGCETGNTEEVIVGRTFPGVAWISPDDRRRDPFVELDGTREVRIVLRAEEVKL